MLDLYSLTPEGFEDLCYKYICALYQKPNYSVEHTRYVHDGGRDIEVTFYDELSHFKIWAECKQHKRNIGLDEIGKNVVLVISKHINKVIFFSASEITENAKIEISRIADRLNFEVSFLCGKRLIQELVSMPLLIEEYFGQSIESIKDELDELVVVCSISEYESDTLCPVHEDHRPILMKDGELFNIYIHLSNCTAKPLRNISVEAISIPSAIKMYDANTQYEWLAGQGDFVVHFRSEIISRQTTLIELPQILVSYYDNNQKYKHKTIFLPPLDISKCKHYPVVGKEITEFLANDVGNALEMCHRCFPQVFDIRGVSGSGKSRLADEIQKTAARQGFRTIYLNSADYVEFDLVRKLLCELLHLPFYRGKIDYSRNDIIDLVQAQGGSIAFATKIAHFLEDGKLDTADTYYMVEAVVHFLLKPYRETAYCVTIDNSQGLHPEVLRFLMRLVDVLTLNHGQTLLTIVSNIERKPVSSAKNFHSFLAYLSEKAETCNRAFTHYLCKPLTETDATLLLMHLFQIRTQSDPLLTRLLQIAGRLPFELIMTLEYLSDMKIIEWQDAKEWKILNQEKFSMFLSSGCFTGVSILQKRRDAWCNTHTQIENEIFTEILSTIICFEGILPYPYIADSTFTQALLDDMEYLLWLAPSSSGHGITFFHDNIKEFCATQPRYRKNAKVLKQVLRWLKENPEIDIDHRERIEFSCLYHLNRFREAFSYGLDLLSFRTDTLPHADIVHISQILYEDLRSQENPADYITIASIYANAIFSLDNKERGCLIYEDIVNRIGMDSSIVGLSKSCKTLHQAINSQLQSARYGTAIEWIKRLEAIPNLPLEYQFIAKNRFGVAYIALGQFDIAKDYLDNALILAQKEMKNLYWTSTAHSDIALYYFQNWKLLGKDATSVCITRELELAVSDYEAFGVADISRDIEIAWHKAFIEILNENYQKAADYAGVCIELSKTNCQAYGLSRGYNLQALAFLKSCDMHAAVNCLNAGRHACEMYSFPSGIFRMYNNLGVAYCQIGEFAKARNYFSLALDSLEQSLEYKQFPLLTNLLIISMLLNDKALLQKTQKRCDKIPSNDLIEYRKTICLDKIQNGSAESFSFFGFSGISYIF